MGEAMDDQSASGQVNSPTISPQALIVYKSISDQFDFLKKQQWAATNYVVLIYGAIIWLGQHIEHSSLLSWVLSGVAIVTGVIGTVILTWFQCDLGRLRKRAVVANEACFSIDERQALGLKPYRYPYGRGWHVLVALILVCVIGAALATITLHAPQR